MDGILNRLHVATPAPRDGKSRPPCIPPSVIAMKRQMADKENRKRKLEREIELAEGDDYVLGKAEHPQPVAVMPLACANHCHEP